MVPASGPPPPANHAQGRLRFLRQTAGRPRRRFSRGVYLLPGPFPVANMFCGYACVVYATRREFETAAPFLGVAFVLGMPGGRIARLTAAGGEVGAAFDSVAGISS